MKLFEYMGKELFAGYGIPVPGGRCVSSPAEAEKAAGEIGPAVIKAQVLTGKRGKAGGIAFADTPEQARQEADRLIGMKIGEFTVERLLVESRLEIEREFYLSIVIDGALRRPVVLASTEGGMDIEEVPEGMIVKYPLDVGLGLQPFMAREICRKMGLAGSAAKGFGAILSNLYRLFKGRDAELVEINPLVLSGDRFIAADAKVTIDDYALFRQKDLPYVEEKTELEKKAHELGFSFIELDGNIAVMANGAGLAMATLDMINHYGGRPANFLDAGGGASVERTARALELLLATDPKVIIINIFGGITRCDDVANAFAAVKKAKDIRVPVVFRLVGTNQEAGREILDQIGVETYRTMHETAEKAVKLGS